VVGTLFTHHQKCVVLDTQASGNNRKITAFIGGLDLCDGRYDTPEHRLFGDLDTVFENDIHNPTFPVSQWIVCIFATQCIADFISYSWLFIFE
jgi:phospholipase D1/2